MAKKSFSVRIDEELLHQFRIVAAYHERSINGQLLVLIRQCIAQHEQKLTALKTFPLEGGGPPQNGGGRGI